MAFFIFGSFNGYHGWQLQIIRTCQKFHEQYGRYPTYIRMKEKTLDALFDENELAFADPYSEEHAVYDSAGNLLLPIQVIDENTPDELPDEASEAQEMDETQETDDDVIYPMLLGTNSDGYMSFQTNKFELLFLEGEDLPEGYFIVQFGDGPDDGGEEFDEDVAEATKEEKRLAA